MRTWRDLRAQARRSSGTWSSAGIAVAPVVPDGGWLEDVSRCGLRDEDEALAPG